jgi:hypothetical protein
MSIDPQIVGRVSGHHLREIAPQEPLVGFSPQCIAADQAVPAQFPNVAGTADRRAIECKTCEIVGRVGCRKIRGAVHQQVNLAGRSR